MTVNYLQKKHFIVTLKKNWLSIMITIILSGFVTSLPAFFYLFTTQFTKLIGTPKEQQQFTVFLQTEVDEIQVQQIIKSINRLDHVGTTEWIDKETTLKEMQELEGVSLAINILGVNPLYHSLVITPLANMTNQDISKLKQQLQRTDYVQDVRIDEEWAIIMGQMIDKTTSFLKVFALISAMVISSMLFYFSLLKSMGNQLEIKLKFLLGAYPWQLYKPYAALGLFNGFFSGVFAILILSTSHAVYSELWKTWGLNKLLGDNIILPGELLTLIIVGSSILGLVSSFIANYWISRSIYKQL